ncbi:glycosyltransferase family 2 protein [bacterium]|nr:glycosyltransferase family 2 protein [bacterium]
MGFKSLRVYEIKPFDLKGFFNSAPVTMEPILVVIPAYNSASSLGNVIAKIRRHLTESGYPYNILVVNDGSTDLTAEVATGLGVLLINHAQNLGKGAALKTAFQYADKNKYAVIATMDSDLQHDPSSLPSMLSLFMSGNYDLVIGTRQFDMNKMSLSRIISNRLTSRLISMRAKQPILDSQSGYRIMRTSAIRNITLKTSRFETESEIVIRLAQNHCRIGFYPIDTIYAGEKSNIRHVRDTLRFIKMYIGTILH